MVATVNEVEAAPLMDTKRAENDVADGTTRAEEGFGLGEESIHMGEAGGGLLD
jgi:hypothetical protein